MGIIMFEDVFEVFIKDEIIDEMDNLIDVNELTLIVERRVTFRGVDSIKFMSVFEYKMNEEEKFGENEVSVIVVFLLLNVVEFKIFGEYYKVLRKFIEILNVVENDDTSSSDSENSMMGILGVYRGCEYDEDFLYRVGELLDVFMFVF